MYHKIFLLFKKIYKKIAVEKIPQHIFDASLRLQLFFFHNMDSNRLFFAILIAYRATGFTSRLTAGSALPATGIFAVFDARFYQCLNVFHSIILRNDYCVTIITESHEIIKQFRKILRYFFANRKIAPQMKPTAAPNAMSYSKPACG